MKISCFLCSGLKKRNLRESYFDLILAMFILIFNLFIKEYSNILLLSISTRKGEARTDNYYFLISIYMILIEYFIYF